MDIRISDKFEKWDIECRERFNRLKNNEEILNKKFINLYGYENELSPDIEDKNITLTVANLNREIKSLISYLVGCLFGRYSLEKDGLIFAGGELLKNNYGNYLDDDGILPIYQFLGIENGLTNSICKLVKKIYGDTYYEENLNYIADALGRSTDESSEDAINRYLNNDFYNDHIKIYQKRPIYWMFSSGKQGAFKCLIYIHRYNKNTLAIINSKYFLPRTAMYKDERERIEFKLSLPDIETKEKKKLENELLRIESCEEELLEYGQVLDYLANKYIDINLDDGIKANYNKFQGVNLEFNGVSIVKNLLIPFGLEEKNKK